MQIPRPRLRRSRYAGTHHLHPDAARLLYIVASIGRTRIGSMIKTRNWFRACSDQVESPASETHAEKQGDRAAILMQSERDSL